MRVFSTVNAAAVSVLGSFMLFFFAFSAYAETWLPTEGEHFLVLQQSADSTQASEVLKQAESDLKRIAAALDDTALLRNWTNQNRVRIFLYETKDVYQKARAAPEWAAGDADYERRSISGYGASEEFLETTLSHEIAHLVLFDLTVRHGNVPRWLHEGFAIANESKPRPEMDTIVKAAAREGKFLPLVQLTIVDVKDQKHGAANVYYAESQAFARFLITRFGGSRFRQFILNLSEGLNFEAALLRAYGKEIKSLNVLEDAFVASFSVQESP